MSSSSSFNDAAIIICLADRRRYYYTRTSRQNWREGESQCNTRSNAANIESRQDCTHCKQPSYTNVTQLIPPLLQHSPLEMRGEKRRPKKRNESTENHRKEGEEREDEKNAPRRTSARERWKYDATWYTCKSHTVFLHSRHHLACLFSSPPSLSLSKHSLKLTRLAGEILGALCRRVNSSAGSLIQFESFLLHTNTHVQLDWLAIERRKLLLEWDEEIYIHTS